MATITLEYDARNSVVKKIFEVLFSLGVKPVEKQKTQAEKEFYKSLQESKKIASEIKKHGTKGQKTLDQLLSEI